jgi:hypothetical protein
MQLTNLNVQSKDVDVNPKSLRIFLNDNTFKKDSNSPGIPIMLSKQNVRDINEKKRFINIKPEQIVKSGGALPLLALIPAAAALFGGLASGTSSIVTAVNTKKKLDQEIQELKRHNKASEASKASESRTGGGYILNGSTYKPKSGGGFVLKKKKCL